MIGHVHIHLIALSKSKSSLGNFVLILEDDAQTKRVPIIIGKSEAHYIGITVENLKSKRPLTHDILCEVIEKTGGKLEHVILKDFKEQIFHADLKILDCHGEIQTIDCRVSDAIALAIKMDKEIYMSQQLFELVATDGEIYSSLSNKTSFKDYTLKELEELLEKVVQKEDFESAIRIREAIKNRKNNS